MKKNLLVLIWSLAVVTAGVSHAAPPTAVGEQPAAEQPGAEPDNKVGPEFEFRHPAHIGAMAWSSLVIPGLGYFFPGYFLDRLVSQHFIENMYRKHQRMCRQAGNCRVERQKPDGIVDWARNGGYRVIYDDGWWFEFIKDPQVVEVKSKPLSIEGFEKIEERLQKHLFDVAKSEGLTPWKISSGGHLNFGLQDTFKGDAMLFRNFLVDFANHSELASGVFQYGPSNAPALASNKEKYLRFQEVIARFDRGELKTIEELAKAIHEYVNRGNAKSDAISLATMFDGKTPPEYQRVEIRASRAQQSAKHFLRQAGLVVDRIRYLKKLGAPVALEAYRPPVTSITEGAERYRQYVTEAGRNYADYVEFMPWAYRQVTWTADGKAELPKRGWFGRCRDNYSRMIGI